MFFEIFWVSRYVLSSKVHSGFVIIWAATCAHAATWKIMNTHINLDNTIELYALRTDLKGNDGLEMGIILVLSFEALTKKEMAICRRW